MAKSKKEAEFLESQIGKEIKIAFYRNSITGKLVNVNPKNLTMYVKDSEGNMHVVPFRAKHIYYIEISESKE